MKKIKEFMAKPITWGDYTKMCVGCYVAGWAIIGLTWAAINHDIKKRDKELDEMIESEDDDNVIEFGL